MESTGDVSQGSSTSTILETVRSNGDSSHPVPIPSQPSPNNFSILYFNASILPKLDELRVVMAAQTPSIVCIVESWLCETISDFELSIENYHLTRFDRNRLTWEVLSRGSNDLKFLSLSINSPCSFSKHCVSVLYRPPSSPVSFFDNL